ncbi:MAG TPA: hypothetical protein VH061_09570 [Solirubrobacteraceae bacterium]|nr:hypothetical protein [Solirubrobacteraceae bacterium]
MPYLNCPSCGLTLAMRRNIAEIEHCPRCLARARRAIGLFVSAEPRGKKPTSSPSSVQPSSGTMPEA